MNKAIVITGASGFVGTNLSSFLQQNRCTISALSLKNKNWKTDFLKSADAIIHLAGKAHDTSNISNPDDYYLVNRDLTIEVFDAFLNSTIENFFYFSSVKAAADTVDGILTENQSPSPVAPYGKSKLEAEKYILSHILPQGKKVYIIRPCMIHGPGNKGNLNLLYKIVEKGLPWPLASFKNKRSFLGIDNLNYLIKEMLMHSDLDSGIYNFADDEVLSTNELILCINQALGKRAKFWSVPKNWVEKMAGLGDKLRFPLNSERLQKMTESYVVSNQKIKLALGIEKLPLTAEEGLLKTIKSFKKEK